ncbi:type I polyketide synthase [Streptomyces avermitilis]|uniref:type I polyketide synthase n=1 Tax=Streptomyces avermitilis TaxID=33903 RepID=UPI0036BCF1C7
MPHTATGETGPAENAHTQAAGEAIAVVSMGCRFPGADSPEALWELLVEGQDATTDMPTDRGWDLDTLYDPQPRQAGKSYTTRGGFLHGADEFDAEFFGISPREALAMDPQQRLLLEVSWEALERARIRPAALRGSRTGVFVGLSSMGYGPAWHQAPEEIKGYALTGTTPSVASGRLAYTFGFRGPALTVDTACSSSLVAVHLAVQSLRRGECSLALAGGAMVHASPGMFVEFSQQRALAPDGRCKPFSAAADGTAWGEGAGVLLLERLSDARRNGHPVLALVRGSAVNQDGASARLTAPSRAAQGEVIRQALADSGVRAGEIDLLEGHSTGTVVGDPVEVNAVLDTYGRDRAAGRPLWIGSVKSNIGHAAVAAGVAGVIKMVLALEHGLMPRTLHVDQFSTRVDWSSGAVRVLTESVPWPDGPGPRRAAVSSFGVAGTNAHAIIEQAPRPTPVPPADGIGSGADAGSVGSRDAGELPWLISARSAWALRAQAARLRTCLTDRPAVPRDEVGQALLTTRTTFEHRAVLLGSTAGELQRALGALALGEQDEALVQGVAGQSGSRPVFVFPGQGAQWVGMGRELLRTSPEFAADIDECAAALEGHVDWSLRDVLEGRGPAASLERDDVVQPALFAVMVATARLWQRFGVQPAAVIGHSQGEVAAAHVAGALTLPDALKILLARTRAVSRLRGRGAMVSVPLPVGRVEHLLKEWEGRVSVAAVNGPNSVVVSGDTAVLDTLCAGWQAEGLHARRLPVGYASHSAQVEAVRDLLLEELAEIQPVSASTPFHSTVTGGLVDTGELTAEYWYRNLRRTVQFETATRALLATGDAVFIEMSPHPVLAPGMEQTIEESTTDAAVIGSLRRGEGGMDRFRRALAEAHVRGVTVDWSATYEQRPARPVDLPTYPFDRQRYWWTASSADAGGDSDGTAAAEATGAAESQFWAAVEQGDTEAVARELELADPGPLSAVLPALSAWHRRNRSERESDAWRYRVGWQQITATSVAVLSGVWVLVVPPDEETQELAASIAKALNARGAQTVTATVDPSAADPADIAHRLRSTLPDGAVVGGLLSLLALDHRPHRRQPTVPAGLAGTVHLLRALDDTALGAPLWCATRGAVSTGPSDPAADPAQAQVWGLGRVAALEQPRHWGGLLDLPDRLDDRSQRQLCAVLGGLNGEDQVALRPGGVFARRLRRAGRADLRTNGVDGGSVDRAVPQWHGTVLITGGTGALGAHVARRLARRGAEHLVLASRSGTRAPGADALAAELTGLGAKVTVAACDAADRAALDALLASLPTQYPLTAVVHAAGVLDDGTLETLDVDRLATVLAAKAAAARNLDELTRDTPLSAFVLFSSASGVLGQPGQAGYAAANASLDALAEQRRAQGLPATSIAWGGWAGSGLASDTAATAGLRRSGIAMMAPQAALHALELAVADDETCLMVADLDWPTFVPAFSGGRPSRLIEGVPEARRPAETGATAREQASFGAELAGLSPVEQTRRVLDLVRTCTAQVLRRGSADAVRPSHAFKDAGFDSLCAVELRNRLSAATGLRLASTLVYDHPTPAALAAHLHTALSEEPARSEAGGPRAPGVDMRDDAGPRSTRDTGEAVPLAAPAAHAVPAGPREPIAITAMACRFPGGVATPEALWQLVADGADVISPFPTRRGWDTDALYDPELARPATSRTREGGFLHDADEFDAAFFGISPREALAMDPQQRLALETAWEAIERAGIDPTSLRGTATGTFIGCTAADYGADLRQVPEDLEGHLLTGTFTSVLSGRIAYTLGLSGPAMTVDTACSSSLVALHLAAQALRAGDCTMALAGGVTVMSTPVAFTGMSRQGALAPDGRSKAFSADADGMGMAEGIGVLLLEKLSDARRHGHPVLAVLRGSAVNSDGASNGLTAPSGPAQQRVIQRALADAALVGSEVDAVEAHGTGTVLGDPIEARALQAVYGQDRPPGRPLWLGSVKSNIGHSAAAAGVAGVIKTVLAIHHGVLPRTLHAQRPSPEVDWSDSAVALLAESVPWPETGRPRRAGVSSFGISGTNAHVILEQAPPGQTLEQAPPSQAAVDDAAHHAPGGPAGSAPGGPAGGVLPWVLSGRTEPALRTQARRLLDHIEAHPTTRLDDLARALATTRTAFEHRAVVLGSDRADLIRGLGALSLGEAADNLLEAPTVEAGAGTVFVFPGQGAQWDGMARGLLGSSPVFAETVERCAAALHPYTNWSLTQVLQGRTEGLSLDRADVVQPALWAVMVALAEVWRHAGIQPQAVIGHSQGEVAAAYVAGALTLEDAARVVAVRSQAVASLADRGAMASVWLPSAEAAERIARYGAGRLSIAAVNGPASTVVCGDPAALEAFLRDCESAGVFARRIAVDYASHCAQVEPLRDGLITDLSPVAPLRAQLPFYSTVTGSALDTRELDAGYWYRNLRRPVAFEPAVRALITAGYRRFVEVAPHTVLSGGIEDTLLDAAVDGAVVGTLRRGEGGPDRLTAALAEAYANGLRPDWATVLGQAGGRHVALPTYPFERERYWLHTATATPAPAVAPGQLPGGHPLLTTQIPLADHGRIVLMGRLSAQEHPWATEHALAGVPVLPAAALVDLANHAAGLLGHAVVEELVLHAPLVLPGTGTVSLQLTVDDADESGRRPLSISSRAENAKDRAENAGDRTENASDNAENASDNAENASDRTAWILHATGFLAPSQHSSSSAQSTGSGPWPPKEAVPVDLDRHYERLAEAGVTYGPALRGLSRAWLSGDEVCAEAVVPTSWGPEGAAEFGLHPALLDAAFQALALALPDSRGTNGAPSAGRCVPFSFADVELHATGARELRIRITRTGPDTMAVHACDALGSPVLTIGTLALRAASQPFTEAVTTAIRHTPRPAVAPTTDRVARPHEGDSWRVRWAGLDARGRESAALDLVRAQAAAALRHPHADAVPADRAFKEIGFDSVMALDLRNRLHKATGIRLPATAVFDHPTATRLAHRLCEESPAVDRAAERSVLDLLDELESALPAADATTRTRATDRLRDLMRRLDERTDGMDTVGTRSFEQDPSTASDDELLALIDREFGRT